MTKPDVYPDFEILHTLCAKLGKSDIHVAEYLTELPPIELLRKKLHEAIQITRSRLQDISPAKLDQQFFPSSRAGEKL